MTSNAGTDDGPQALAIESWGTWAGDRSSWPVTPLGAEVADWAIGVHRAHYGDAFMRGLAGRDGTHPFIDLRRWPLRNPHAIVSLLSRACALTLLPVQARQALAPKPSREPGRQTMSDLDVLEVAGLALRDGWTVDIEPLLPSGRRPDLSLARDEHVMCVEVTQSGPDGERRKIEHWNDHVMSKLMALRLKHDVAIQGHATSADLTGAALERFFERLDAEAHCVARTGSSSRLVEGPLNVRIQRAGSEPFVFDGPPLGGDMWPRLQARIMEKAHQTAGAAAAWVVIQERSDLFELTDLGQLDERGQLVQLVHNMTIVLGAFPHVCGVVLTTGVKPGAHELDRDIMLNAPHGSPGLGSRVLCRRLPGGRCRTTFVVLLDDTDRPPTTAPPRWFESEGSWLDWALRAVDQPPLDTVLSAKAVT